MGTRNWFILYEFILFIYIMYVIIYLYITNIRFAIGFTNINSFSLLVYTIIIYKNKYWIYFFIENKFIFIYNFKNAHDTISGYYSILCNKIHKKSIYKNDVIILYKVIGIKINKTMITIIIFSFRYKINKTLLILNTYYYLLLKINKLKT